MCYKDYDEWVRYVENKYSSISLQKSGGDIKTWFNTIKTKEMEKEIKTIIDIATKHQIELDCPEITMIVATIAWCFDSSNYNEKSHKARSMCKGKRTRYSSGEGIFASLRSNWDKNDTKKFSPIQLDIPSENQEGTYNWIEMCSALQKRYGIFSCLKDLNKFVFSVGDMKNPKGIQNYGFYVRDIKELCLAYSILHGYSSKQYNDLYMMCQDTINAGRVFVTTENTRTEECRGYFENDLTVNEALLSNNEELCECEKNFIDNVKKHTDIFLKKNDRKEKFAHWTALKNVLFDFTNKLSLDPAQKLDEGTTQIESEKTFQERVQTLWQTSLIY